MIFFSFFLGFEIDDINYGVQETQDGKYNLTLVTYKYYKH